MRAGGFAARRVIAVDFGNSTTKIAALTGGGDHAASLLEVPGFSCRVPVPGHPEKTSPVIPSLIHYPHPGGCLIGSQVTEADLGNDPATVRWMSWYLARGSPVRFRVNGRLVSYPEAAADFLTPILTTLRKDQGFRTAELVFVVPSGNGEDPGGWLTSLAETSGFSTVRVIDTPAAAVAACLPGTGPGDPFMVIDIGGDRIEVSIATLREDDGGPGSRLLGSASSDTGGSAIDRWLCEEVLQRAGFPPPDPGSCARLLPACCRAKESLSGSDHAGVRVTESETIRVTRGDLARILDSRGFFSAVLSTIDRAVNSAFSRGYTETALTGVIMAGGTCAIPAVGDLVRDRFPAGAVICDHPLDAVVRGAAISSCGTSRTDRILNEYVVRVWNPSAGAFDRKTLVRPGTPVPSGGPVARIRIQATYDGQARMGIPLYELQGGGRGTPGPTSRELVMGPSGRIEVAGGGERPGDPAGATWINERTMTLIPVDPPAVVGEPRLEVWFSIDASRMLRASARDIRSGRLVMENHPVARLR